MNVTDQTVDLAHLRLRVFKPATSHAAVVAYSDIFQQTPPHVRMCRRLAAYGYTVISPELYGRYESAGTAFRFEEDRQRALDASVKLKLEWIDEDVKAALDFAQQQSERVLACGWCIGGHVAFRAALDARVKATVCFYATGLHSDTVGAANGTAKTLDEATRLKGELLLIWGTRDPHIPIAGRHLIHRRLAEAAVPFQTRSYDAEHTFMRDEGARWEPAAADQAFADMLSVFERFR
jgi:carboxymethylenebutenolidase